MKIAILGTAANPLHNGHTQLAESLLTIVDEVWIMPCYNHMYNKIMVNSTHRLNMCDLISTDRIKIFDYEIKNKLSGKTYDLIKMLKNEYEHEFFYVIGLDNANTFDKWYKSEELKELINFIVVSRKGIDVESNWFLKIPHIYLDENIMEISSTEIRNLLKNNLDVSKYLDEKIIKYIKDNNLYK